MPTVIFKVAEYRNGLPFMAEVAIEAYSIPKSIYSSVDVVCQGDGWKRQGDIEDASSDGYDDWKVGAKVGALFALQIMGVTNAKILVTRISGLSFTDTNSWAVAEAAAKAVWKAFDYTPDAQVVHRIEEIVKRSWKYSESETPTFDAALT